MANPDLVKVLIDKAEEIQEAHATLLAQRAANKRSLRDLAAQDLLTEEQLAVVEELYPERERKSDEERLAEAEEKAAALRERLEAEAAEGEE